MDPQGINTKTPAYITQKENKISNISTGLLVIPSGECLIKAYGNSMKDLIHSVPKVQSLCVAKWTATAHTHPPAQFIFPLR